MHRLISGGDDDRILAIGRVHLTDDNTAQIRYMAVESGCRRQGLGSLILHALEHAALETGVKRIVLQAREAAIPFYLRRGYTLGAKTHRLFDDIQHYHMSKNIE